MAEKARLPWALLRHSWCRLGCWHATRQTTTCPLGHGANRGARAVADSLKMAEDLGVPWACYAGFATAGVAREWGGSVAEASASLFSTVYGGRVLPVELVAKRFPVVVPDALHAAEGWGVRGEG